MTTAILLRDCRAPDTDIEYQTCRDGVVAWRLEVHQVLQYEGLATLTVNNDADAARFCGRCPRRLDSRSIVIVERHMASSDSTQTLRLFARMGDVTRAWNWKSHLYEGRHQASRLTYVYDDSYGIHRDEDQSAR